MEKKPAALLLANRVETGLAETDFLKKYNDNLFLPLLFLLLPTARLFALVIIIHICIYLGHYRPRRARMRDALLSGRAVKMVRSAENAAVSLSRALSTFRSDGRTKNVTA